MKAMIIVFIIALLPYQITLKPMSQELLYPSKNELYPRNQVIQLMINSFIEGSNGQKIDVEDWLSKAALYYPPFTCFNSECEEKPAIFLCTEHYNELLEKNEELAEEFGKKEAGDDSTMEPAIG